MAELYLALDQGGHASRAIVFDGAGRQLADAFAPLATLRHESGHIEHDPGALIGSVREAIDDACTRGVGSGDRMVAAGLATQRSSIVCWNRRTAEALSPVISWQDRRNAAWLQRLEPRAAFIRAHTGLVLSPHYGASKMRWCLDHLPAVQRAAADGELVIGPLSSFVSFRLLAQHPLVVDPANASRTQLWDPATQAWSPVLCALFGIDATLLPACVPTRHEFGTLDTPAGDVPMTVVTGDQSAVPFAFGPLDTATAWINVGTGAFIQRKAEATLPDLPRLLASVVWSDGKNVDYMVEGTVNGAGAALDWFADLEQVELKPLLAGLDRPETATLNPPLFLNGVAGVGSPFWVSDFESRFVGEGTLAERLLAVLESIAFLIGVNLEEIRREGPPLERVLLAGGLSTSDLFCRILANVCGVRVLRSAETQATARGLAWLVAGGPPDWPARAANDRFEPRTDAGLAARFAAWRGAMQAAIR